MSNPTPSKVAFLEPLDPKVREEILSRTVTTGPEGPRPFFRIPVAETGALADLRRRKPVLAPRRRLMT